MEYNTLLSLIVERYNQILCKNLIGIYAHGSIGFGCFNWARSDIDFLVVVNNPVSQQEKLQLLEVLINLSDKTTSRGFEISVVLRRYCEEFVYPTPFELHFSNSYLEEHSNNPMLLCHDNPQYDYDLAAHFTVIKTVGIVLYGEPITKIFGKIPKEAYLDSICRDVEDATENVVENPEYAILNLCRVYTYIKDKKVLSKEKGGQWALDNLSEKYHNLIRAIIDSYVKGITIRNDELLQIDFCEYMLKLILHKKI